MGRIGRFSKLFALLNLSFFDKSFFLTTNALQQYGCWFNIWLLWHEFAMDGKVEYLLT